MPVRPGGKPKPRVEKRVAVMVSPETHLFLWEEVQRLCNAHETGCCTVEAYDPDTKNPAHPKISLERMIVILLDARQRHRERRRAYARRRRDRAARFAARVEAAKVRAEDAGRADALAGRRGEGEGVGNGE